MKNHKKSKELSYTVVEFMWRDLKLKPSQAIIFTIIVNYKSYICNIQELMRVTKSTEATVRKQLKFMETEKIIICKRLYIKTNVARNIYVAKFNPDGTERTQEEITSLLDKGKEKCYQYYDDRGKYRKGCKKDKKYNS